VKISSAPLDPDSSSGLTQAIVAEPSAENATLTSLPLLRPVRPGR
jgi:hypothetical protein